MPHLKIKKDILSSPTVSFRCTSLPFRRTSLPPSSVDSPHPWLWNLAKLSSCAVTISSASWFCWWQTRGTVSVQCVGDCVNGASRAELWKALAHAVNKLSEDIIHLKNDNDDDDDNIFSPFYPYTFGATFRLFPACHGGSPFANNTLS